MRDTKRAGQLGELLERIADGESLVVEGDPGAGKTELVLAALAERLQSPRAAGGWSPVVVLTPDRRRAVDFETRAGASLLGSVSAPGGHRLVRSINSYAYLVVSQWLVERVESRPRPQLFGGAEEDVWISGWLERHADQWQAHFPAAVIQSESLRMELRNLLARAGEAGLGANGLRALAAHANMPTWALAADAFEEYAGAGDIAFSPATAHLDAARIQVVAARTLDIWEREALPQGVLATRPVPDLVLVDDLHECTAATLSLLRSLARGGAQIVATSCEMAATTAFRGGQTRLGTWTARALRIPIVELGETRRQSASLARVVGAVGRWMKAGSAEDAGPVTHERRPRVSVTNSDGRRGSHIADLVRSYHFVEGVPWNHQAVVVRQAGDIDGVRRALRRKGVPVAPGRRALQFSRIPVCEALLKLLRSAPVDPGPGEAPDDADVALELVLSPLVNVDRLQLFQYLRAHGTSADGQPRDLLYWMSHPQDLPRDDGLRGVYERLGRAAQMWARRVDAARQSAGVGLWTIWEASECAAQWQKASLAGGWEGEQADERLDSVIALFRRADLWEQQIHAKDEALIPTAAAFAQHLLQQEVVADSIADVGVRPPGVEIVTVAEAAGREWDVVCVVGLQDGGWPMVTRPTGLLEVARLSSIVQSAVNDNPDGDLEAYIASADPGVFGPVDPQTYRRERRREEARLLACAVSRPRCHLHLFAIENEDQAVSPFLNYLAGQEVIEPFRDGEGTAIMTRPMAGLDMPGFIGSLRYATIDPERPEEHRRRAARMLAVLARTGLESASPEAWTGNGGLSSGSLISQAGELRLNPSRLETASDCLLRWFFSALHGEDQQGILSTAQVDAAAIGNLIHQIAEEHPYGTTPELQAALDTVWGEGGFDDGTWWAVQRKESLDRMIRVMASRFSTTKAEVRTEVEFETELGAAKVRGRVDRMEIYPDGSVNIIDIKTGDNAPTKADTNLQLVTYQLALREEYQVNQAALFTVAKPGRNGDALRTQAALTDDEARAYVEEFEQLADKMLGPTYTPRPSPQSCRTCRFVRVCPAKDQGNRGIE